jgi:lipopolysaccharide export system permease protein
MAMLLSCLLALGQIGRQNELTAMRAAGIGVGRIAAPLLLLALGVSALVFALNEVALPHLNARRATIYRVEIKRQDVEGARARANLAYLGSDGRTFLIKSYTSPRARCARS